MVDLTVHVVLFVDARQEHAAVEGAVDDVPGPFAHHGRLERAVEVARADVLGGVHWLCDALCEAERVLSDEVHVDPRVPAEFDAVETQATVHEGKHAVEVLEQVVGLVDQHVVVLEHANAFQHEVRVLQILGLSWLLPGHGGCRRCAGNMAPREGAGGVGRATRRAVAAAPLDE